MFKITHLIIVFQILSCYLLSVQDIRSNLQNSSEAVVKDTLFKGFNFPLRDSIRHINLGPVEVISPWRFQNQRQEKKYNQLETDVLKAYPLALIVGSELNIVNSELDKINHEPSQKKVYIKWYQHYVYNTYMDSLKTLNVRQGRLLLKLIHRETGRSPYTLIKSYRGGWNAFFWQAAAWMYGANLNSDYNPEDDAMIEHIIRRYKSGEFN